MMACVHHVTDLRARAIASFLGGGGGGRLQHVRFEVPAWVEQSTIRLAVGSSRRSIARENGVQFFPEESNFLIVIAVEVAEDICK